jgi:hypothetical protein
VCPLGEPGVHEGCELAVACELKEAKSAMVINTEQGIIPSLRHAS